MEEHLADRIKHLTDECGLINEFKLAYSVREEMPLHYALAKALAPGARGERGGDVLTAGQALGPQRAGRPGLPGAPHTWPVSEMTALGEPPVGERARKRVRMSLPGG